MGAFGAEPDNYATVCCGPRLNVLDYKLNFSLKAKWRNIQLVNMEYNEEMGRALSKQGKCRNVTSQFRLSLKFHNQTVLHAVINELILIIRSKPRWMDFVKLHTK